MDYIVRLSVKADSEPEAIAKVSGGKLLSIYPQPALDDKIAAVANPIKPRPWPIVLLPLKLMAKPEDRGAGDIIARTIGPIGGEAYERWHRMILGKSCGCPHRQESLNQRWPL